jgi:hypothetical protein
MLGMITQSAAPPQHGSFPNPWALYDAQCRQPQAALHRGGARRQFWILLIVFVSIVTVATAVGVAVAQGPQQPDATASPTQHAGYTGSDCNFADIGSRSRTDPWPYAIGIPACAVHSYPSTVPGLDPTHNAVTTASLAHVDSRTLLWAMFKRQDTQPISSILHTDWVTPYQYSTNFSTPGDTELVQIDYAKRTFVDEDTDINITTGQSDGDVFNRCVNRKPYDWSAGQGWAPSTTAEPPSQGGAPCDRLDGDDIADAYSTDGVSTGGLNNTEADKLISYLDHITGLVTTKPLQAVQASNGKTYIALDVQVTPQDPGDPTNVNPSVDLGLAFFQAAFAQTGLSVHGWPYSMDLGAAQGVRIRYYVDPTTLLPAYSVMMATAPIVTSGPSPFSPGEFTNTYTLNEYSYPSHLDPANMQPTGTPTLPVTPWPFPPYTFS